MDINHSVSGIVFDIDRCSMNDGPGIRTTVFLKGCPLSCKWCHNPESQRAHSQLSYRAEKCIMCRRCEEACPQVHRVGIEHTVNYSACKSCGRCVDVCRSDALKIIGKTVNVQQIMDVVRKDIPYYRKTGGGLTVSGGEPFSQPVFLLELLKAAKMEGISTCIETSGFTSEATLRAVMPFVDLFLFDYKATSSAMHKQYTGVGNEQILKNFRILYEHGKDIILRCPIIPGYNDTEEHFRGIALMEKRYPNLLGIEILPYHNMGKSKAASIGKEYEISAGTADEDIKKRWKDQMIICGCSQSVIQSF